MSVWVLGRGKVGRALSRGFVAAGVPSQLLRAHPLAPALRRAPARTGRQIYLLAVPDGSIRALAAELAPHVARGSVALHCAGARDLGELSPLAARGLHVGVFHPLVSFARGVDASALVGATFTTFGDPKAVAAAKRLARALGARAVALPGPHSPERAAAYHASAALVANGAAALAYEGVQSMLAIGFEQRAAERALAGLLASVAKNVARVGVPAALTGPVVRGDVQTVERHLRALARLSSQRARAYAELQPLIVSAARAAGLLDEDARAIVRAVATSMRRRPK